MAFDFERYLQAYELDSTDLRSSTRHQISLSSDEEDILPVGKNDLFASSKEGRTTCLSFSSSSSSAENEEKSRLLDALSWLNQSEPRRRLGLERIESKFRSHQDSDPKHGPVIGPGNRQGLSKQKSLPASFSREKTKASETRRRRRSSVRFADEIGENLTTFLMIPSRFDEADAAAAAAAAAEKQQTTNMTSSRNPAPGADDRRNSRTDDNRLPLIKSSAAVKATDDDEQTLFQLCFDQPAANFSEFRRRLSLQFVCLENARIEVKPPPQQTTEGLIAGGGHGVVVCSIKVRNIHPVKRVFARCTDNAWTTYADISAAYVSDGTTTTTAGHGNEFDTFTFALSNPLRSRVNRNAATEGKEEKGQEEEEGAYSRKTAAVEFALCYQVLGTKYWDNNDGRNYKIVWM